MFFFWYRLNADQKKKVWRLYGFFTGLGCIGSIFGAIASYAEIRFEENLFEAVFEQNLAKKMTWSAEVSFWVSILALPESLNILFINVTLLMVLDRIIHVAFATSIGLNPRIVLAERVVMAIVVSLSMISVGFSAVNTESCHRMVPLLRNAAAAAAINQTDSALEYNEQAQALVSPYTYQAVQSAESASFLFMVANFIVVLRICSRRIQQINERAIAESSSRLAEQNSNASNGAPRNGIPISDNASDSAVRVSFHTSALLQNMKDVHLQILVTVAFVFVALLVITAVKLIDVISDAFQNDCSDQTDHFIDCHPCRNNFGLAQIWYRLTPELWSLGVSMPQPLALLVALWAMTSKFMLQMIKIPRQEAKGLGTLMQEM